MKNYLPWFKLLLDSIILFGVSLPETTPRQWVQHLEPCCCKSQTSEKNNIPSQSPQIAHNLGTKSHAENDSTLEYNAI